MKLKYGDVDTEELLHKYRDKLPTGFKEDLAQLSWGTIANLAIEYQFKIKESSKELRKIHKELSMTQLILSEKLKDASKTGNVELDAGFLKRLISTLEQSYRTSIQYEIDLEEFLIILSLVIEKLKKEKLIVYDPKGGPLKFVEGSSGMTEFKKEKLEVDAPKGSVICPECGATNLAGAKKCVECGCNFKMYKE